MMGITALRKAVFGGGARQATEADRHITDSLPTLRVADAAAVAGSAPLAWRRVAAEATGMWAATRVAMVAFTYFAVLLKADARARGYVPVTLRDVLYSWKQWDGYWYTAIAERGYWSWQSTAFFPFYPMLIKASSFVAGQHWLVLAMLIAQVGALGAFIGVGLLAAHERGSTSASQRALRIFAAYPLAFFLAAPYTEGMFIAFAAFSLFFARRGSWRWAALSAFLAGLTRPTGIILVPALAWEFGRQHGWWRAIAAHPVWGRVRRREWRAALASLDPRPAVAERRATAALSVHPVGDFVLVLGAVPLAIGGFMTYLYLRFQHPLVFYHAQQLYWNREDMPIWKSIPMAVAQFWRLPDLSFYQARDLVDLAPLLAFTIITVVMVRRQPFAFTLYMVGALYLAIQGPVLKSPDPDMYISAGRFLLAAIPIFLVLGRWTRGRPWLDLLLVSGGFMLQAVLAAFFLSTGWLI